MLAWRSGLQLEKCLRLFLEQLGRGQNPAEQHAISASSLDCMCIMYVQRAHLAWGSMYADVHLKENQEQ